MQTGQLVSISFQVILNLLNMAISGPIVLCLKMFSGLFSFSTPIYDDGIRITFFLYLGNLAALHFHPCEVETKTNVVVAFFCFRFVTWAHARLDTEHLSMAKARIL